MSLVFLFPPSLGEVTASARGELLADWLSRRLRTQVAVAVAETYSELEQRVRNQEVDLAWAPPSICARVEGVVRKIYKSVRSGRSSYQAAIVVSAGAFQALPELEGKRAAWVDELSTAGHLLAVAYLRAQGVQQKAGGGAFLGSYRAAVGAVLDREADFCSVFVAQANAECLRTSLTGLVGAPRAQLLKAIAYTEQAPNDGLVVTYGSGGAGLDLDALAGLVHGPNPTSLLLSLLDADCLEPARAGDYDVLKNL